MAMPPGYPPSQTSPPPTVPMYPPQAMMISMPTPKTQRLLWGSLLMIVGAIIGGIDLVWLGLWLANPAALLTQGFALFQTLGTIIALAGVSAIFTGVGWAIQSWGRGL